MYTFIKRTVPPPVMLTFDASTRDQCEVRRLTTSTPLQALVMLNDPTVLEASRVLAERLNSRSDQQDEEKINQAFRLIVCREPKKGEKELLNTYHQSMLKHFEENPLKADKFLEVGEYTHMEGRNSVTTASLMQVIHTIYNMEEAIVKS